MPSVMRCLPLSIVAARSPPQHFIMKVNSVWKGNNCQRFKRIQRHIMKPFIQIYVYYTLDKPSTCRRLVITSVVQRSIHFHDWQTFSGVVLDIEILKTNFVDLFLYIPMDVVMFWKG